MQQVVSFNQILSCKILAVCLHFCGFVVNFLLIGMDGNVLQLNEQRKPV
jgi:hypothetical protein